VTFLFTDVEGSTRLWEEHGEEMNAALARHDELLRRAVGSHHGHVVKTTGDGGYAVFPTAHDGVGAALEAQRSLSQEDWGPAPFRVRMGIHTGEAELRDGDYFGPVLNRAARLMGAGHGGQVLLSQVTTDLAGDSLPAGVGLRDLGVHRLRDLSRPERVFQLLGPGCAAEFPPLRTLDAFPGNLPAQLSSFVGRTAELTRLRDELARQRLVTLTGVGGVGKTRLALEVAGEAAPDYPDGAWLVELAGVRDPNMVAEAVVASFGLQPLAGFSAAALLLEFLQTKALLLVLDNCEHLLRPVGNLVGQVMRACPTVRVLATSREGLNVVGERMLGVASLEVPDDGAGLDAIAACDAVVLFGERARAVKINFGLDASNADAVGQVCRRLDGIPLAIELAAARVGMLTPSELAGRLDHRFRLLAGGQRSAVERHQTLRAAIDWSYELLSDAEKLLLARVSVFAGGFTLEAAEAVTAGDGLEADAVLEVLASLVSRSLVDADTEDVEARYRLLETIRQYAQDRLAEGGDVDRMGGRHAAYYTDFGQRAIANVSWADGLVWERRLDVESDNFRAALAWAIDTRATDTAVRLLGMWDTPTRDLSDYRDMVSTVHWATDLVLSLSGASASATYPAALVVGAWCAWSRGDPELALQRCDEAVTAGERLGTDASPSLLGVRSNIELSEGRADDAVEHAGQAVGLARALGPSELMQALRYSALARTLVGDRAAAVAQAEEIVALRHQVPDARTRQGALVVAAFALADSEPERALALAREVVGLLGPEQTQTVVWAIAGDIAARNGQRLEALAYLDKNIEGLAWVGQRTGLGPVLALLGTVLADDDPEAAAVLLGAADSMAPAYAHARHHLDARKKANRTLEGLIGRARYEELHAQGEAMSHSDTVRYAHDAISRALDEHAST
jgi:predicted ATPase/class 3 adenylate cyclase